MVEARGVLDMPPRRSRDAPETFKGDYTTIRDFIMDYEQLCRKHNIDDDADKVSLIRRYCSRSVREVIEGMLYFTNPDWDNFKRELLRKYNDDLNDLKFSLRDLRELVALSKQDAISNIDEFRNYERNFIRVGGWLLGKGKINEQQSNYYFWKGLPKTLRNQLERKLYELYPTDIDVTVPFKKERIIAAAEVLFPRNRFDMDDSDDEEDLGFLKKRTRSRKPRLFAGYNDDDDSESDTLIEESDDEDRWRSHHKTKKNKTKDTIASAYPQQLDNKKQEESEEDRP
ncbi:hypothetical protein PUNSTDRAFT_139696 [Punctularia strigosozonata HHB-11173 SS5]|uniref:Uncharacterized protein n=1 Tax=Punctularia strigosozonata (strain HHB-11173) TaxID=741275 RepID=R7S213_PUNST|nr:uncharacterized protein PUNSTDRAFT_139696 [Punctularia strigosozonata HHB-11173 SS5]EIN03281.1 hypothetical protein PUNSTDRAFT_139696 [Punctularia strigosozonata HHB-11173 SS5]